MPTKKITVTLNPQFYALLIQKSNQRMMSIHEYIHEALRDKAFALPAPAKKSNAGRPKKNEDAFLDMFSRKR